MALLLWWILTEGRADAWGLGLVAVTLALWLSLKLLPPKKPGLGVEVNEALVIERSQNAPDWRNPVWRHADGAVAEW